MTALTTDPAKFEQWNEAKLRAIKAQDVEIRRAVALQDRNDRQDIPTVFGETKWEQAKLHCQLLNIDAQRKSKPPYVVINNRMDGEYIVMDIWTALDAGWSFDQDYIQ